MRRYSYGDFKNYFKGYYFRFIFLQSQENVYEPPKTYTPEGAKVHEQEQSGEKWHGVLLSELSKLAQQTYRGRYVEVDKYGFLVFNYSSNSRKTKFFCSM